jgi:transcriptional regulator with XRE-family HTH domain
MQRLTQNEAARLLGVSVWTLLNWEKGHAKPPIESMPAILQWLGEDPYPEAKTLPERMLAKRRAMGWSIQEAARQLGVEEGTWGAWERGETILFRKHRLLVARLLGLPGEEIHREMGDRWNRSHARTPVGKT